LTEAGQSQTTEVCWFGFDTVTRYSWSKIDVYDCS